MPNDVCIKQSDALEALMSCRSLTPIAKLAAVNLIMQIPAADMDPKQRWVPVTERLPECEVGAEIGNVEWIIHDMVFAGCFGRGGKYRDAYFRTWTDTTEGIDAKDADCWRVVTIPEPPKEDNEEVLIDVDVLKKSL